MNPTITAVVLAAGKGTRMKSNKAKVLHEVFFQPMLHHVLHTVFAANIEQCAVIVGHQREAVLNTLAPFAISPVIQEEQLGTGHAVLCAETACASSELVLILCGDTPLIRAETLQAMIRTHQEHKATLTLLTTLLEHPFGYGRIVSDDNGGVACIVEEKDATPQERAIKEINAGIYLVEKHFLFNALKLVGTDNSQGEVYLTDIVEIAKRQGLKVEKYVHADAIDVLGVNSRVELAQAHATLQARHNRQIMLAGVTLYQPESILIDPKCTIGKDSVVYGNSHLRGTSTLGQDCLLESGCVVENCQVGDGVRIGAHAVLRQCDIPAGSEIAPLTYKQG